MNRIVRGTLYASSLLLVILVLVLGYQKVHEKTTDEMAETQTTTTEQKTEQTTGQAQEQIQEPEQTTEAEPASETETEEGENIVSSAATTLVFTGDILIGNSVSANYSAKGIDGILSGQMKELLNGADITMVNEEFPFGTGGVAMEDKQYTFRVNPSYVAAFGDMGVDVVSLANNHILDYGPQALEETFAVLDDAGIRYAGAGEDKARAMEPQIIEVNRKKFGFLAASRVIPVASWNVENQTPGVFATYDAAALNAKIEETKKECDYLTVYVHWGLEHKEYPEDYEHTLAEGYVNAGADLVIGSHPHCLQGVEYINGKPVFSPCSGQFPVRAGRKYRSSKSYSCAGRNSAVRICCGKGRRSLHDVELTGEVAKSLYDYLQSISFQVSVDENGIVRGRVKIKYKKRCVTGNRFGRNYAECGK